MALPKDFLAKLKEPLKLILRNPIPERSLKELPGIKNKTIITLVFVVKAETLKSTSFPAVINKWFLIFFWNFEVTLASPVRTKVSEDCASH